MPRKFAMSANVHLIDSTEEESFQFIVNMSTDMSSERSTTGKLFKLVCSSLMMLENFKNFEKFKTLIHN